MNSKLLDELLEIARSKRPNWAQVRVRIRDTGTNMICNRKLHHVTNSELGLCLELIEAQQLLAKATKKPAKKKVKKKES